LAGVKGDVGDTAKLGRRLAAQPDVHRVRRPVTPDGAREFDLYYVRSGLRIDHPVLVVPDLVWPRC